ncbi:MAG: hypothetical protein KDJ49_06505 [Alphaproteobacteria bacterium]|nr:hypothetical protein [Alphaproteobacteria bacterium]
MAIATELRAWAETDAPAFAAACRYIDDSNIVIDGEIPAALLDKGVRGLAAPRTIRVAADGDTLSAFLNSMSHEIKHTAQMAAYPEIAGRAQFWHDLRRTIDTQTYHMSARYDFLDKADSFVAHCVKEADAYHFGTAVYCETSVVDPEVKPQGPEGLRNMRLLAGAYYTQGAFLQSCLKNDRPVYAGDIDKGLAHLQDYYGQAPVIGRAQLDENRLFDMTQTLWPETYIGDIALDRENVGRISQHARRLHTTTTSPTPVHGTEAPRSTGLDI